MATPRVPTATNRMAAADIQARLLTQLRDTMTETLRPLHALATHETVSPTEAVAALAQLRAQRRRIDRMILDLAGTTVLGGGSVRSLVDAGLPAATLTRRLPATPAAWRGRELVFAPASPHGWKPL